MQQLEIIAACNLDLIKMKMWTEGGGDGEARIG